MIIMDTCAVLWDALEPQKLTKKALEAIDNAEQQSALLVADISIWEIAMLIKKSEFKLIQQQQISSIYFCSLEISL